MPGQQIGHAGCKILRIRPKLSLAVLWSPLNFNWIEIDLLIILIRLHIRNVPSKDLDDLVLADLIANQIEILAPSPWHILTAPYLELEVKLLNTHETDEQVPKLPHTPYVGNYSIETRGGSKI